MTARYCSQCGDHLITGFVAGRQRLYCSSCGFILYRNPLPVGMAVVEHNGRLLLIRRANPPLKGYWAPPTGYVEIDESVEEATVRETQEETGLEIILGDLLGVYSEAGSGIVLIAYNGRVREGQLRAGEEALDVSFFAPGKIPAQPPPQDGPALDKWFFGVIETVTAPWKGSGKR